MSSITTLYLAGPVMHADDGGHGWRDEIKADIQHESFQTVEALDPLDKYSVGANDVEIVEPPSSGDNEVTCSEIVQADKQMIDDSDAVFVGYEMVKQVGTPMEVIYAYQKNMPIGVWLRDDTVETDLSPWYRHHVDVIANRWKKAVSELEVQLHGQTKLD